MKKKLNFLNNGAIKNTSVQTLATAAVISTLSVGVAPSAMAQDDSRLEEITVTGSRITRRDMESNSPIITVEEDFLTFSSSTTVDESLRRLPQFAGNANTGQNDQARAFGGTGLATLSLRNLGANRNLVLMDGRRMQPATVDFAADVNIIPAGLIQNIEVITGGASAAYGSDAISGVVNFKLKDNFEGFDLKLKYGSSEQGDYSSSDVSILAGTNMADGRGNIVFGVNYSNRGEAFNVDRDFFLSGYADGQAGQGFLGNGLYDPSFDAFFSGGSAPSAIVDAAVGGPAPTPAGHGGLGFNSDGSLFGQGTGVGYTGALNANYTQNSQGAIVHNLFSYDYAATPMERYSFFTKANLDITDSVEWFGQATYSHYVVEGREFPTLAANFWSVVVPRDGAHPVSADLATVLDARGGGIGVLAPWAFSASTDFAGLPTTKNTNQNFQIVTGLKGELDNMNMSWDVYASHGQTDITAAKNTVSNARYAELIAAPFYGADYSTVAGTCTSGISPFVHDYRNPSTISQDCIDYITINPINTISQEQDIIELNLQGTLGSLPAGDALFATGLGYRKNTYETNVDSAYNVSTAVAGCAVCADIGGYFGASSSGGDTNVKEAFVEVILPLLADAPMIESLELGLAYRYSNYDTVNGVNTYKTDLSWAVNDTVRVRGGYQRAVRAPNPNELFSSAQSTFGVSVLEPCLNAALTPFGTPPVGNSPTNPDQAQVQQLCSELTGGSVPASFFSTFPGSSPFIIGNFAGNANLSEETADTYTLGTVFQFQDLWNSSNLNVSIDLYNIEIEDAIGTLSPVETYERCFNYTGVNPGYDANNSYCQQILRGPTGLPQNVAILYQNSGGIKTDGVDIAANWSMPVSEGDLSFVLQSSYLMSYERSLVAGEPFVDEAGFGTNFDISSLLTTTYSWDDYSVGFRWKYLSEQESINCAGNPFCTDPAADAYNLVDLFGSYMISDSMTVNFGIDNAFDEDPVVVNGQAGNTIPGVYDVIGRNYYMSFSASF